jgi:hypothetical protein
LSNYYKGSKKTENGKRKAENFFVFVAFNGIRAYALNGMRTLQECLMATLFLSFYVIQRPTGAHAIECHFFSSIAKKSKIISNFVVQSSDCRHNYAESVSLFSLNELRKFDL